MSVAMLRLIPFLLILSLQGKLVRLIDEKNSIFTKRDTGFIKTEQDYLKSAADLYKIIFAHRYDGLSGE
jgi:hypothetical protein